MAIGTGKGNQTGNSATSAECNRELGEPTRSEFTVVKVDAYNGINAYLSELSGTRIKTVEDIIAYNIENRGTEGAGPGDHPAFPSGQVSIHHSGLPASNVARTTSTSSSKLVGRRTKRTTMPFATSRTNLATKESTPP